MTKELSYESSGVNIDVADAAKREMAGSMETSDTRVLNRPGAFASLFEAKFEGVENPVLVLKAEEPGSKQLLAFQHDKVEGVCYDLINHLVNDIIVMGAKPEVVLDIILCGKMEKDIVVRIVDAISKACRAQDCQLIGGETSEQPKVLPAGGYMLNASVLGVVDKSKIIDGSAIKKGDVVLSIASNGLHTNGYSLVRKLMEERPEILNETVDGDSFIDAILRPHQCYYQPLKELFPTGKIHGLAHITGGGVEGNLNRILPEGLSAAVDLSQIEVLELFKLIKRYGGVNDKDMMRTFNMGVGIALVADPADIPAISAHLTANGCAVNPIGQIVDGDQTVTFTGELRY
ncbi:phosphoribosylformylglycinamidine cyclo-ligase [Paenibacillus athensensis]|uniref:Phosphoribosylformylglycinamidine cyclo-ligase n=1 Tax=Paenibacillus athensensis TaxID=1967502 RepID=A0A4Y8PSE4_9BACL|nr:phosphoribosylformylglycinamidine cyclo-ligase [Paenibacillus athensensis]MCD1260473.1 phosphoribosylformylglycinamidine cyclo-ligase [Paenibacillus athensensis]